MRRRPSSPPTPPTSCAQPVSVIKSACEYAEKYGDTPEEQRETIAMIHRQADRMSALIGQLLSITPAGSGHRAGQAGPG